MTTGSMAVTCLSRLTWRGTNFRFSMEASILSIGRARQLFLKSTLRGAGRSCTIFLLGVNMQSTVYHGCLSRAEALYLLKHLFPRRLEISLQFRSSENLCFADSFLRAKTIHGDRTAS